MKRLTAILALIVITVSAGYSQNLKFGHVNGNEVVQALPEFDSANVKLENFQKELINALELMSVELNNKNDAYTKEEKNLTDLVKQTKQQEIIDLNRRMQDFQAKAQDDLRLRQQQLFQPIQEKVEKAIKDVGKENGFVYIFDIGTGVLLYFDETKSTDVTALVKGKLGVK
ncbi:MAG TPA: OmpH family outer membrane protein [Bacteroidales bacterium]|nr:OmpH family outer membrane protein [Bacteroidales bacterium]HPF03535.1 OmpH family outer membrane protein [Bacteroidales bacterium]HPJ60416.1 OmpH family outer membrane protein [Bacteroidales bacterium]HPR12724.1 OmpH family outer membrane protein [Bacteroidales bacterium]HRW85594.1 OmpH family outer membrane protein [Bacteroidales bacterium]